MNPGRLSRPLARVASVLWIPISAIYTIFLFGYLYATLSGAISPTMPEPIVQLLVYLSIAVPGWFLVWALWTRPSWRIATTSAIVGSLLFLLLVGTLLGIVALAAGLLPLVGMAIRPQS